MQDSYDSVEMSGARVPRHEVSIYVARHCSVCAYAYEIAALIRRDFPDIAVRLVDVAEAAEPLPESVFATPTYLIDGRRWFLGNPSPAEVFETLSKLE